MSYSDYVRGLRLLGEGNVPLTIETREDYELAARTLDSLQGSVIGAGSNTWRRAKDRYEVARKAFREAPTPCQVVLYNVSERCQNVGPKGYCRKCERTVINVMHRTCDNYGIALD